MMLQRVIFNVGPNFVRQSKSKFLLQYGRIRPENEQIHEILNQYYLRVSVTV
jgi:hypothetical protein